MKDKVCDKDRKTIHIPPTEQIPNVLKTIISLKNKIKNYMKSCKSQRTNDVPNAPVAFH